jgi:hypothetical protein
MNVYQRYIASNEDKTNAEICDIILQENDDLKQLQKKSIMRRLQHERQVMSGETEAIMVTDVKMKSSWKHDAVQKNYVLDLDGVELVLSEAVVDFICSNYTQPTGMTASAVAFQVCSKFSMSTNEVNESVITKIIQIFAMTKSSPPFSPHEVINMDSDTLVKSIIKKKREKIESALSGNTELTVITAAYNEEVRQNLRLQAHIKRIGELFGKSGEYGGFGKSLDSRMAAPVNTPSLQAKYVQADGKVYEKYTNLSSPKPTRQEDLKRNLNKTMHVMLCDWHIGKKTANFNAKIAMIRVEKFVQEVVIQAEAHRVAHIVVHINGDMVDGPSGIMHAEQWAHQDVHGDEQIDLASSMLAEAIGQIDQWSGARVAAIHAIGGNHGRFVPDRNDDPGRMADVLTYKMMKEKLNSFGNKTLGMLTTVYAKEDLYVSNHTGLCVVGHHGDKLQKDPISTIWELSQTRLDSFNKARRCTRRNNAGDLRTEPETVCWVWLHGHRHSNVFEEIQTNIYSIRGGSLAGADEYSLRIGKGARASQAAFVHDLDTNYVSPIWVALD